MKSRATMVVALIGAISLPSVALANMGTPLMWATILHMVIGNACIGLLEGAILGRVYQVPATRAMRLMVMARPRVSDPKPILG